MDLGSSGVCPHSIWNQISIFFLRVTPARWAASVRGKFYGMARSFLLHYRHLSGCLSGGAGHPIKRPSGSQTMVLVM